jgi:hypothetical protein
MASFAFKKLAGRLLSEPVMVCSAEGTILARVLTWLLMLAMK